MWISWVNCGMEDATEPLQLEPGLILYKEVLRAKTVSRGDRVDC